MEFGPVVVTVSFSQLLSFLLHLTFLESQFYSILGLLSSLACLHGREGYNNFLTSCTFLTGKDNLKVLVFSVTIFKVMYLCILRSVPFQFKSDAVMSNFICLVTL